MTPSAPDTKSQDEAGDEEATVKDFGKPKVMKTLAEQEAALAGAQGMMLWTVSSKDGAKLAEAKLDSVPVWDGLAVARGRVFVVTGSGKVVCLGQ